MQIKVVLFSNFRELLPPENHGRTTLDLQEGATIQDALEKLDIHIHAIVSLNGQVERNTSTILKEGDEIQVFRPIGGGVTAFVGQIAKHYVLSLMRIPGRITCLLSYKLESIKKSILGAKE
jgi:sulfur carrier protein ThiS